MLASASAAAHRTPERDRPRPRRGSLSRRSPPDRRTPVPPPRKHGRTDPQVRERRNERAYRPGLRAQAPRARAASPATTTSTSPAPASTPAESTLYRARGQSTNQRHCAGRRLPHHEAAHDSGMAGGPIRRMISNVVRSRSSSPRWRVVAAKAANAPPLSRGPRRRWPGPSGPWPADDPPVSTRTEFVERSSRC